LARPGVKSLMPQARISRPVKTQTRDRKRGGAGNGSKAKGSRASGQILLLVSSLSITLLCSYAILIQLSRILAKA
jgi:hypothetical protein